MASSPFGRYAGCGVCRESRVEIASYFGLHRPPLRRWIAASFRRVSQTDLQALADRKRPTDEFLARLAEVEAREKASAKLVQDYGVTEFELKSW